MGKHLWKFPVSGAARAAAVLLRLAVAGCAFGLASCACVPCATDAEGYASQPYSYGSYGYPSYSSSTTNYYYGNGYSYGPSRGSGGGGHHHRSRRR